MLTEGIFLGQVRRKMRFLKYLGTENAYPPEREMI